MVAITIICIQMYTESDKLAHILRVKCAEWTVTTVKKFSF